MIEHYMCGFSLIFLKSECEWLLLVQLSYAPFFLYCSWIYEIFTFYEVYKLYTYIYVPHKHIYIYRFQVTQRHKRVIFQAMDLILLIVVVGTLSASLTASHDIFRIKS